MIVFADEALTDSKVEDVVRILCVRHQREAGYRDISY